MEFLQQTETFPFHENANAITLRIDEGDGNRNRAH